MVKEQRKYRFSGHETFPFRYAWLPKAVQSLIKDPKLLTDEEKAMVELGVGKNMVRSIRFWAVATGIAAAQRSQGLEVTWFGRALLGDDGLDPYLEDGQTLWLLHWKLASQVEEPLFAWDYLLHRWHEPEFTRSAVLRVLGKEAGKLGRRASLTTLSHHLDVFLHTYVPTRGAKASVKEDNLDCPLVELNLIERVGDREIDDETGKREPIFAFRYEAKPEISPELFAYCIAEQFGCRNEATLPFREICVGHGSPGQVFKLPESEIRERLSALEQQTDGTFSFEESASIQQVHKKREIDNEDLLKAIYCYEAACA